MKHVKSPKSEETFTTIKVRKCFRKWLKLESAKLGVPMYQVAESHVAKQFRGEPPWQHEDVVKKLGD